MKQTVFGLFAFSTLFLSLPVTSSFDTADLSEEGVVVVGDTGKDNDGQLAVSQAMEALCQSEKCDYGMLTGDNVYPVGLTSPDDPVMERLFDKYYNKLEIPFLVTLGNHDYGKFSRDWKRGLWQLGHMKKNPNFYIPSFYYSYQTENAVIAVLDTTRLMWKKDTRAQAQMVNDAYQEAVRTKKWFLVLGHHPFLSNGKHGNAGNYERLPLPYFVSGSNVRRFMQNHVCGKAHFYFSGHDHSLQVFDGNIKGCDTQLIVSGSGASSTKLYKRNQAEFESTSLGFFHLSVLSDVLRMRAIDKDGVVLFEKNYLKP
jgi:tartrate-resistant acid phosphatase type 5